MKTAIGFPGVPTVLSLWSKQTPVFQLASVRVLFVLAITLGPSALLPNSTVIAQQPSSPTRSFPATIQWNKQKGVTKYRLQIADDADFRNIFYDGRVVGERYTVRGLAPGYYYWRIAPSERQTGAFFRPIRFFVSGGVVISVRRPGSRDERRRLPATSTSRVRSRGFKNVGG